MADLGCGVGRSIPELSPLFGEVVGMDHSADCLEIARRDHEWMGNVRFLQRDLTRKGQAVAPAEVVLCINVALIPDFEKRRNLIENVPNPSSRGGGCCSSFRRWSRFCSRCTG